MCNKVIMYIYRENNKANVTKCWQLVSLDKEYPEFVSFLHLNYFKMKS